MSPRPKSTRSLSSVALSRNPRLSKSVSEKDLSRWSADLTTSEKSGKIKEIIELLERQACAQILRASDARRETAEDSGVASADSSDEPADTADDDDTDRDEQQLQQPQQPRPVPRPRQERLNEANKATSKFQQIQQMWTDQEPSSPAPQSPAPDSGHQSMPLKSWNGVGGGSQEQRRASSGGTPQLSPAPAGRQETPRAAAAVNGAKELPHKAELELRKRYAEQAEEIKQLKNMLNIKEQRIRELEDHLDRVLKDQNESVA